MRKTDLEALQVCITPSTNRHPMLGRCENDGANLARGLAKLVADRPHRDESVGNAQFDGADIYPDACRNMAITQIMYPVAEIDRSRQRPTELAPELPLAADVRRLADTPRKRGIVPQSDGKTIIAPDEGNQNHPHSPFPS